MKTSRDKFNRLVDELIKRQDGFGIFYKSDQTSDLYHKERSTIDDLLIRSLNVLISILTGLRTKDWKNYPYTEDALYTAALVHAASEKAIKLLPESEVNNFTFDQLDEDFFDDYVSRHKREKVLPVIEDEIYFCTSKLNFQLGKLLWCLRFDEPITRDRLAHLINDMKDVERTLFRLWKFFVWLEKYELKQIKKRAKQMELKKSSGKTEEHKMQHGMGLKDYGMRCATIKNPDGGTIFITTSTDEGEDCE